jgi:hypothetical protein
MIAFQAGPRHSAALIESIEVRSLSSLLASTISLCVQGLREQRPQTSSLIRPISLCCWVISAFPSGQLVGRELGGGA